MRPAIKSVLTAGLFAAALAGAATPAAAAVTLLDPACSLSTGCEFSGNINGAGTALETQNAYNAAKNPDILLNYLGKSDSGFGSVSGGPTGTWSAPGFVINYIAVKSGPGFMLYSVTPGANGTYTTAGLQNGNNQGLPGLSHLAFFGNAGAVPEPASWAMMIGGFGLVGGAMRRRGAAKPALA